MMRFLSILEVMKLVGKRAVRVIDEHRDRRPRLHFSDEALLFGEPRLS